MEMWLKVMPSWGIHDKYAKKMDISEEVSRYVNELIDFPQNAEDYKGTRYKISPGGKVDYYYGHDEDRSKKTEAKSKVKFLRTKGRDYLRAWCLHHILDYIEHEIDRQKFEDLLDRAEKEKNLDVCEEWEHIKEFVREHKKEVLNDLRTG